MRVDENARLFFSKRFCQKRVQTEMAGGKMTKVALKIAQNVQQFILIVSWQASVSSTHNFLTKIPNAIKIADLSAR